MGYVKAEDILDATNGGLDIILSYYPDAHKVFSKTAKRFKIRSSEKTASAALKELAGGVWVVTDFGGDSKPRDGIAVCALEEGFDYAKACEFLGARYNIKGADLQIVKPLISKRPLEPHETPGDYSFDFNKEFTDAELKLLGPRVNGVHCKEYRLWSCKSFVYCKENEAIITTATPEFPIFVFDYGTWQKIYQPLSADKGFRFRYAGQKPKKFIFGLDVIRKEFERNKKKLEEIDYDVEDDDDNEDGEPKRKKDARLDAAFIMSGGSDGLNLRSFAKYPIWFNSEAEHLDWNEYKELKIYVKEIYYIGDLDSTGIKQAINVGLKFLDIKLIWLPEKLKQQRDKRGNPRKDFKDYIEVYYRETDKTNVFLNGLNRLIENSLPLQFWTEWYAKKKKNYNLSNTRLYHFLEHMGFGRHENENFKDGYIYVRKEGSIVRVLKPYQIANYIHEFLEERGVPTELRDYVFKSPQLGDRSFSNLRKMKTDFTSADRETQYFFFNKEIWQIKAEGITRLKQGEVDRYVWEDKIIDFDIKMDEPHFKISKDADGDLDIEIIKKDNMFFNYLINTSRVHWRYELEEFFEGKAPLEAVEYGIAHKFDIAGPNLDASQKLEHKLHLINKMFSIGYMLHSYKNYNKPWAVFAMDNKVSDLGESHGGSGKSLCYGFLNKILKRRVYLKGRDPKLTTNDFIYHEVTEDTDYILIDDATQYLNFDFFFSEITGSLKVNPKNGSPFEIPFEKSPKFVITSNFSIRNMDPSTARRILFTVFSDYYHSSDEEYNQIRKVSDDFGGRNLFTDFTKKDYNDFYNFCAQCVQFFLSVEHKINPPMDNVTKRNLLAEMGEPFLGWADAYFQTQDNQGTYLYQNTLVCKADAFDDFIRVTKQAKTSTNKFKKSLKAYCQWMGWVFNPKEKLGAGNRIVMKIEGKTMEAFYMSTVPEMNMANTLHVLQDDESTIFD